jgi:FMN-dependent NADH-azoreductase
MKTILHHHASACTARSLTRRLSQLFVDAWLAHRANDRVIRRDLAADPPPHVTEAWIAAVFTPPDQRDAAMRTTLAWSDAAPMYNYGMLSALKAWFDQVIRVGRTFSFDLGRGDWPLEPILAGKRLVVLSARGEFGFAGRSARGPEPARPAHRDLRPLDRRCRGHDPYDRDRVSGVWRRAPRPLPRRG